MSAFFYGSFIVKLANEGKKPEIERNRFFFAKFGFVFGFLLNYIINCLRIWESFFYTQIKIFFCFMLTDFPRICIQRNERKQNITKLLFVLPGFTTFNMQMFNDLLLSFCTYYILHSNVNMLSSFCLLIFFFV